MRATQLNNCPVPGLLLEVPQQLNNDLFLRSINLEWQVLVNNMRRYLMKEPKKRELDYQRQIGKEVVDVGNHLLRTFVVSLPLQTTIFGDKYNKLKVREVVRDTNNTLLVHVV